MWGLYRNGLLAPPIRYSNGKTQEDVVKEIIEAFSSYDIVALKGGVGTGKSAIAIHVVALLGGGKGIIVVPTKVLEEQYVRDYGGGKFSVILNGRKVKFASIMGRSNFPCLYKRKCRANNPNLPCTVSLKSVGEERRIDVAKDCPHWSPIVSQKMLETYTTILKDAIIREYISVRGKRYIFIRDPCPFYKQYLCYADNCVILMNSAIWEIETISGRKPMANIEVIDEADAWLDSLSFQRSISAKTIQNLIEKYGDNEAVSVHLDNLLNEFTTLLDKYRGYTGTITQEWIDFIEDYSGLFEEIGRECNLKILLNFSNEVWMSVGMDRVKFFIPDLKVVFQRFRERSARKLLLMSATFQSKEILEEVFGIDEICFIEGETKFPGTVYLRKTGKEVYVTHKKWSNENFRKRYFDCLKEILAKARRPLLVQVHSKKYLPEDKKGVKLNDVQVFNNEFDEAWSTIAKRGLDLKGDKCRAICILKYPIPDLSDGMMQAIRLKLGDEAFFKYCRDMADRELIQQVGRAVRSPDDWVEVWSPDLAVHQSLARNWKGRLVVG